MMTMVGFVTILGIGAGLTIWAVAMQSYWW